MPAILQVRNIYLKIILLLKIEKKFEFVIYEMSSIKIIRKGITVEYSFIKILQAHFDFNRPLGYKINSFSSRPLEFCKV